MNEGTRGETERWRVASLRDGKSPGPQEPWGPQIELCWPEAVRSYRRSFSRRRPWHPGSRLGGSWLHTNAQATLVCNLLRVLSLARCCGGAQQGGLWLITRKQTHSVGADTRTGTQRQWLGQCSLQRSRTATNSGPFAAVF